MNIELSDILTIVFSLLAAAFSIGTYFKGLNHDKKQDTLNAFNQLQEQALDKLNLIPNAQMKLIASNPKSEEYKQVSTYLARLEHFCVGVELEIYDRKTVYKLAHGFFERALKIKIAPFLEKKKLKDEEYYQNLKKVISWMEKEGAKIK